MDQHESIELNDYYRPDCVDLRHLPLNHITVYSYSSIYSE